MYAFLIGSLGLLAIWLFIFGLKPTPRKEMFWVSFWTAFLGLTEPFFVPEYWNPPTLFNLAQKTGFDIESIVFAFAVGGIASVIYEAILKTKHIKMRLHEIHGPEHRFHYWILAITPITFLVLWIFTKINPIYSTSLAMFAGAMGTIYCRRDLKKEVIGGGLLFLTLYFIFFFFFNLAFPGYIDKVWNLEAISGIKIWGTPIEELLFALTLGMLWSSLYEHLKWYKLKVEK